MNETNPLLVAAETADPSVALGIVPDDPGAEMGRKPSGVPAPGKPAAGTPRPPGRPPTHGLYSKAAGSDGKRPVRPLAPEEIGKAAPLVDGGGLSEVDIQNLAGELLNIADETAVGWLRIQAAAAKVPEAEAKAICEAGRLGERRQKFLAKLVPHCVREWGLQGQVSPTTALALMLGLWGAGIWRATVALSKFKAAEEKEAE